MIITKITSLHKYLKYNALVLLLAVLSVYNLTSKEISKPWLQGLDANQLYVLVESDDTKDITVNYRIKGEETYQDMTASTKFYRQPSIGGNTYVHRILLNNLKYGTEYEYWIDSKEKYHFRVPNEDGEFTFANMGDSRSGTKFWRKIITNMGSENPDFMIFNGDLAYKKEYNYWIDEFFVPEAQTVFTQYPFYNTPGNHEKWNENTQAFTQSTSISKEPRPYYSFERGDALFLILNTEVAVGANSQQWKFAEEQLKHTHKKWKIVVFHIPAYSSGAHGENKAMKLMTEKIFEKQGVQLILTGHSHFYQHNLVNGIHHMVIGSGGSGLATPVKATYTIEQAKTYHHALVNVNSDRIKLTVKDIDMKVIEDFEIK
jgi:predicted phosphodiesterase